jgi:hypothetical protein
VPAPAAAAALPAEQKLSRVSFAQPAAGEGAPRGVSRSHDRANISGGGGYRSAGSVRSGGGGGYKDHRLEVRVSAGGASDSSSSRGWQGCCGLSRRAVWTLLTVLVLVLVAGAGVGVGVAFAKGKPAAAAAPQQQQLGAAGAAAPAMSVFGVSARPSLPGVTSDQRCKLWFGSQEVGSVAS